MSTSIDDLLPQVREIRKIVSGISAELLLDTDIQDLSLIMDRAQCLEETIQDIASQSPNIVLGEMARDQRHDLRNRLNAISCYHELIVDGKTLPDSRDLMVHLDELGTVVGCIDRMLQTKD